MSMKECLALSRSVAYSVLWSKRFLRFPDSSDKSISSMMQGHTNTSEIMETFPLGQEINYYNTSSEKSIKQRGKPSLLRRHLFFISSRRTFIMQFGLNSASWQSKHDNKTTKSIVQCRDVVCAQTHANILKLTLSVTMFESCHEVKIFKHKFRALNRACMLLLTVL